MWTKNIRRITGGCIILVEMMERSALLRNFSSHQYTHDGGHHQSPGPTRAVSQTVEPLQARIEIRVHLDAVGVELQLRGVQQRLIGGKTRHLSLIHI